MTDPLALLMLVTALIFVGGIVWFIRVVRSTHYTALQTFFWLLAKFLTRVIWRAKIDGPFPIPGEGKAVIICNHRSSVDPFFVQVSLRRVVHWMVAREYCVHPLFGFVLRVAQVIPVNRGGIDTASTKAAIRIVSAGGMVGMLPEGRINTTEEFMLAVRPGAVLVALKARAPIVPCYIEGAPYRGTPWSPFLMRARTLVRYGQPIDLSPYYGRERESEVVRQLLVQCVSAIAELAGRTGFEPQLAGRQWKWKATESEPESGNEV
ncbi:MAG: lysophospholipid acyltransferase family protein [Pirellulaceae bacterium]